MRGRVTTAGRGTRVCTACSKNEFSLKGAAACTSCPEDKPWALEKATSAEECILPPDSLLVTGQQMERVIMADGGELELGTKCLWQFNQSENFPEAFARIQVSASPAQIFGLHADQRFGSSSECSKETGRR